MTYSESLDWLYGLQRFGIRLGLENMRRLCEALSLETHSGAHRRFIHVAGTNGKGSVCAMAAAICTAARERTGLYISPHLVSFRERIRLGPNLIPEQHIVEGLAEMREHIAGWESQPTFFEVTTALALSWFQRQRAEWVVMETGLGGRLDATNVITPAVSVIASIGLDHTKYLGGTLAEIAREKAGIIKRGVPVLILPQPPEVEEVLQEVAKEMEAPLTVIKYPVAETWDLSLRGSHQRWNAALAFAAVVSAGLRPEPRVLVEALCKLDWPGRFQFALEERLVLDGAHNPPAAERLAQTWHECLGGEKCTLILGVLADKDVAGVLRALAPLAVRIFCVAVRNPRTMPAEELARLVAEVAPNMLCGVRADLPSALADARAHGERVLVAGSLFLAGETLAHLGLMEGAHEISAQ